MTATAKSGIRRRAKNLLGVTFTWAAIASMFAGNDAVANTNSTSRVQLLAHAQEVFLSAQKAYETEPTNNVAAWQFARAAFNRGEFSTNDTERAALAMQGISACRLLIQRDPKSAPAHYYLGLNAGPDRFVGQLYLQAPGWSVGSQSKARKHLQRAAELAPDYPENRLNLAEAANRWRDKKLAQRELEALQALWPAAKTNFAGADWAAFWADWQPRYEKLVTKPAR
jgi:hypothetical protein